MNNKTIISLVVIIIGLGGLVWWSKNTEIKTELTPGANLSHPAKVGGMMQSTMMQADGNFYDFGTISMKNGNVSKMFKVTNKSNSDITLPKLTTSCMCTNAYFIGPDGTRKGPFGMVGMGMVPKLNATLKAGESGQVEVVYDPNAHGPAGVGMIDRFIDLEDMDGNMMQFEIKANVTP